MKSRDNTLQMLAKSYKQVIHPHFVVTFVMTLLKPATKLIEHLQNRIVRLKGIPGTTPATSREFGLVVLALDFSAASLDLQDMMREKMRGCSV